MVEVKFHDIGEGMTEGEIINYFVQVGDQVKADQPLVEMQTDKMVAEIPSPTTGEIKNIHYDVGTVVSIGSVLLEIDDGKSASTRQESKSEVSAAISTPEKPKSYSPTKKKPPKRIIAAPHTRRIARKHDVDIEKLEGTGPNGRVLDEDIYRYLENKNPQHLETLESPKTPASKHTEPPQSDTIPFTGIRKQIANKMTKSLTTIPHVTHYDEVDLTNLMNFRQSLKDAGEHISVVAFFLKALAITLKEFPVFNAQLNEEEEVIKLNKEYHIGLATNTDQGLLVPVLRDVDKKTIRTIHTEMKELTKKAQDGKLTVSDMQGGTFTISNVGPLGGTGATPIINHPQTTIIAFHKTKKTPVVMPNDEIEVRSIMTMSLSFDHRVMDGADSVMFTNRFNALIEEPKKLILELV
ncbi:dihydrolipoamide acetyltransferase family protein [Ornithinibacillus halophilus]|uniref:Dihydrolipoamide acetyltransferase component of pyruvate dehydrogenase complex n=1 Tax=Ornithinibacillus halophilus TaxID=930117 RepID=A0A1M5JTR3_9BACI|nr:dihydrolipoamide acetyltransferase family protein [Ornithinibacillus halophilus]SHG43649.1 pyruvate dehydrogenase E2 component (dihydrolipoamide acetyltransferase) [Ornithinibacillus halophilus]